MVVEWLFRENGAERIDTQIGFCHLKCVFKVSCQSKWSCNEQSSKTMKEQTPYNLKKIENNKFIKFPLGDNQKSRNLPSDFVLFLLERVKQRHDVWKHQRETSSAQKHLYKCSLVQLLLACHIYVRDKGQEHTTLETQDLRNIGHWKHRTSGTQDIRNIGHQEHMTLEKQDTRNT